MLMKLELSREELKKAICSVIQANVQYNLNYKDIKFEVDYDREVIGAFIYIKTEE